ncbi:MAG: hypothetical protein WBA57_09480 [Elainellaceae cyanobacterium]
MQFGVERSVSEGKLQQQKTVSTDDTEDDIDKAMGITPLLNDLRSFANTLPACNRPGCVVRT